MAELLRYASWKGPAIPYEAYLALQPQTASENANYPDAIHKYSQGDAKTEDEHTKSLETALVGQNRRHDKKNHTQV